MGVMFHVEHGTHKEAIASMYNQGETMKIDKGKPEDRKVYLLIGKGNKPSIARGNTWAESEVTDKLVSIKVVE
jgi:hypothetical protein|tara:strand:- start:5 stop:223 length:219 start_codon:yes stop_codon:yes gene_type:complete